jgi:hypothetical protein
MALKTRLHGTPRLVVEEILKELPLNLDSDKSVVITYEAITSLRQIVSYFQRIVGSLLHKRGMSDRQLAWLHIGIS